MNKKIIYAVVAVLVVVGGVWFYMNQAGVPGGGAVGSPMSIKDLLAKGGSQKCTFSNNIDGAESSGVTYTASGRMRTDFTSKTSGGETTETHMIVDGETTYLWGNQMAQGIKMNLNTVNAQAGGQTGGGVNVDQKMDYKCGNWSPDQGQFSLPSGVTFADLSAMVPPGAGAGVPAGTAAGVGAGSAQCAQCNLISDASAKAQCLAALACN